MKYYRTTCKNLNFLKLYFNKEWAYYDFKTVVHVISKYDVIYLYIDNNQLKISILHKEQSINLDRILKLKNLL